MLSYADSVRKEELELGEIKKKFELRKMQFEMRMQEAYLTVPFDGEIEFLFPYVEGEKKLHTGRDGCCIGKGSKRIARPSSNCGSRLEIV